MKPYNIFVFIILCKDFFILETDAISYTTFLEREQKKHGDLLKTTDIEELKKHCQDNNLPTNGKEIIMFLHSAMFNVDKALQYMISNYQYRNKIPEFFKPKNPFSEEMKEVQKTMSFSIVSRSNAEVHIYSQLKNTNYKNFKFIPTIKYLFMVIEYIIETQGTVENFIFTFNTKGIGLWHIGRIQKNIAIELLNFLKGSLPIRIKGIYIVNAGKLTSAFLYSLINLMPNNVTKKVKEKVQFFNQKDIFKHVPKNSIPSEMNGQGKSYITLSDETYNEICEWFLEKKK
ncbi:tyrosine-protein phosphatase non-receptor type 9-like isoform X1 [Daktulosphaira vitifoliae]|uniref:tyrosine-protein phosphatase non-receptor type 9-like isoform X1 n=1 Tax=Daktulosphaira vitifoliae TaxID=58002 RepID=UPI0021AA95A5|nr:tyrosine-protein phosphatase non-receptor type 9-like isoform X1 [Daktulosphaira vitifoliae]